MRVLFFCNRLKVLKKEMKIVDEEVEKRRRKKKEIERSFLIKFKRFSKYKYFMCIFIRSFE